MSAEPVAFLDTNVLVYAFAADDPEKHRVAAELVRRGFQEGCYVISTQVLLEFFVTSTRKGRRPLSEEAGLRVVDALLSWPLVESTGDLVSAALRLSRDREISPWDAAILQAARMAGCPRVLSEDLSHGHRYSGVLVENPFKAVGQTG